ncbi:hypothetical protein CR513_17759, partial [Mucuna pruriens]
MVLKQILPNVKDQRRKWAPNYEGPYVVKQAFSGGAMILTNVKGRDLKYPINVDSIRMQERHASKTPGRRKPLKVLLVSAIGRVALRRDLVDMVLAEIYQAWSRLSADRRNMIGLILFRYLESNKRGGIEFQFPHSSSQSVSALEILMRIVKGSSIAIARNYAIATSSVDRD